MQFSNDFLWGAASASYQIEGAYLEDGKGENIWDAYCQESGHVAHGENGNVACDHYHRFREDVKMMQKMGIKNYRFSISWTRILPDGTGAVNQKGIQFYSDLVTKVQHGIDVPGTTIHVFYATKMGKKYEKRYWTYFKNPNIRRHNMQHEELFCCHSAEWVEEVKNSVEGDRQ